MKIQFLQNNLRMLIKNKVLYFILFLFKNKFNINLENNQKIEKKYKKWIKFNKNDNYDYNNNEIQLSIE